MATVDLRNGVAKVYLNGQLKGKVDLELEMNANSTVNEVEVLFGKGYQASATNCTVLEPTLQPIQVRGFYAWKRMLDAQDILLLFQHTFTPYGYFMEMDNFKNSLGDATMPYVLFH